MYVYLNPLIWIFAERQQLRRSVFLTFQVGGGPASGGFGVGEDAGGRGQGDEALVVLGSAGGLEVVGRHGVRLVAVEVGEEAGFGALGELLEGVQRGVEAALTLLP